jgi:hypothetical protein
MPAIRKRGDLATWVSPADFSRLANQLMTTVIDDREVASAGRVLIATVWRDVVSCRSTIELLQ